MYHRTTARSQNDSPTSRCLWAWPLSADEQQSIVKACCHAEQNDPASQVGVGEQKGFQHRFMGFLMHINSARNQETYKNERNQTQTDLQDPQPGGREYGWKRLTTYISAFDSLVCFRQSSEDGPKPRQEH